MEFLAALGAAIAAKRDYQKFFDRLHRLKLAPRGPAVVASIDGEILLDDFPCFELLSDTADDPPPAPGYLEFLNKPTVSNWPPRGRISRYRRAVG
ncbi:MAG: hypothetical protein ACRDIA_05815 [Actinomycetota bacterium]